MKLGLLGMCQLSQHSCIVVSRRGRTALETRETQTGTQTALQTETQTETPQPQMGAANSRLGLTRTVTVSKCMRVCKHHMFWLHESSIGVKVRQVTATAKEWSPQQAVQHCYSTVPHQTQSVCGNGGSSTFRILDCIFRISDFIFHILDFRFHISDFRFQISDVRFEI